MAGVCVWKRVITTSIKQENLRLGSRALSHYITDTTLPLHLSLFLFSFSNCFCFPPCPCSPLLLSLVLLLVIFSFIVMKLLIWAAELSLQGDHPSRLINIHERTVNHFPHLLKVSLSVLSTRALTYLRICTLEKRFRALCILWEVFQDYANSSALPV